MPSSIPEIGNPAPLFKTKDDSGKDFDLSLRKGQWTILYFYRKAGTPGCTRQACAFRDGIAAIRELGGDVFGVSADSVAALAGFRDRHRLNFALLSDPRSEVIRLYGCKMPLLGISKGWTFLIDPDLRIRSIEKEVNPVEDAFKEASKLREFITR